MAYLSNPSFVFTVPKPDAVLPTLSPAQTRSQRDRRLNLGFIEPPKSTLHGARNPVQRPSEHAGFEDDSVLGFFAPPRMTRARAAAAAAASGTSKQPKTSKKTTAATEAAFQFRPSPP